MADKSSIMKQAQKFLAKGQIDKAIAEWEKLLTIAPDGNVYNTLGDLYLKKGNKQSAVDSYQKSANFFRHEGFSLKALALYKKILNINPTEEDSLYALGELSEEKGLINEAVKYYLATADSLSKAGKKDRLLEIYEKILSLSPTNVSLRNKVAEIFLKEGLISDAVKEYIYVARIFDDNEDIKQSKEYYQKALGLQPLNKEALLGISYLHESTGEIKSAIDHMKETTALLPDDTDVMLRYAELLLKDNETESARDYLHKIKERDPEDLRARRFLGEIYLGEGTKEQAWKEYLPCIDNIILEEKFDEAIELLEVFKEVDPLETGKRMISLYRQRGDHDRVATELRALGDSLLDKGMKDDALSCYREAIDLVPGDEYIKGKIDEITRELKVEEKIFEMPEVREEDVSEQISIKAEKTRDEIFVEADIFTRYGLLSEARQLLEKLKKREPADIEVHVKLKSLYLELSEKEAFVTECLALHELYTQRGDTDIASKMLKEAQDIHPEDARLPERIETGTAIPTAFDKQGDAGTVRKEQEVIEYEEELAEADFYAKQGLMQESLHILEELQRQFPDDRRIQERLDKLSQTVAMTEMPEEGESSQGTAEFSQKEIRETAAEDVIKESEIKDQIERKDETEYENFTFTDEDLVDAKEIPDPQLEDDVLEIFQEFKKGIEEELGEEDYETHYNLGIAYKEMGLIDDSIAEFQIAKNDTRRVIQASYMLGLCYIEKGLFSLAIDTLKDAIQNIDTKDESYWAIKYDLADAHERNNNSAEALNLYTEIFGWNAQFRNVSDKMNRLQSQVKTSETKKAKERKDRVSYL